MVKPNIFKISTKELSQDAFITWLLQWGDSNNELESENDIKLNKCGIDFAKRLLEKEISGFNENITSIKAGLQWENIDVWALVNENYLIIIEDKTFTERHSNQLKRYKKIAEKWCSENSCMPICVYLKTGNESQNGLNTVKSKGFYIYNRPEFIDLLKEYDANNDIFQDFKNRLIKIEESSHEWKNKLIKDWKDDDWQGFFQFLEKQKNNSNENLLMDWFYVNNPNGGFWDAVLNAKEWWDIYPVFLQTEEYKLCFKLSTNPDEVTMPENSNRGGIRNKISRLILNSAKEKGIQTITRPRRFGNGKVMTVAVVERQNWLGDTNEKVEKDKVVENLRFYIEFLKETINGT